MEIPPGKLLGSAYGTLLRSALHTTHQHPEPVIRADFLWASINARLGALCRKLGADDPGYDVTAMTREWVYELVEIARAEAEAADEGRGPTTVIEFGE